MLQVPSPCIAYSKNPSAARTSPPASLQVLWTEEFRVAARWELEEQEEDCQMLTRKEWQPEE